jgi:catechol 2,3-dioxygenase-like lactoylglutathione lyase family enzyme
MLTGHPCMIDEVADAVAFYTTHLGFTVEQDAARRLPPAAPAVQVAGSDAGEQRSDPFDPKTSGVDGEGHSDPARLVDGDCRYLPGRVMAPTFTSQSVQKSGRFNRPLEIPWLLPSGSCRVATTGTTQYVTANRYGHVV